MQSTLTAATADGTQVVGWLHQAKSETCVLLVPGHNTRGDKPRFIELAKFLEHHGLAAVRMNITRKTVGDNNWEVSTVTNEIQQARAIANVLRDKYRKIVTLGHSQGGITALQLVADGLADAAVFLQGVVDTDINVKDKLALLGLTLQQLEAEGYAYVEKDGKRFYYSAEFFEDLRSWNVIKLIKSIRKPLLFIFGTQDKLITPTEVMKGFEAANQPKELFAIECDHEFKPCAKQVAEKIASWSL